ncbi:hypothetical protein EMIT0P228_290018 [Pseudomonas brassicacearum]
MVIGPPLSRASSLPQWICGGHRNPVHPNPCGSELARDSGLTVNTGNREQARSHMIRAPHRSAEKAPGAR